MRSSTKWSVALGFALGGFFDGILLHQILQWHHLLSLVPGIGDLRMQVLWDGYFHALMYVIAAVAIWGLWRVHLTVTGRPLFGAVLIGFGLWHVVDAVLAHWVLGIHRIRIDSASPLAAGSSASCRSRSAGRCSGAAANRNGPEVQQSPSCSWPG
ncbi:putative membrane protein [Inquilinus ginsengisoli]|uniref:DUF2243 domain-containing protein n=1 Tax=Inquilinus ginsengisoli TaxID=363840 RepID=UPI003D191E0E